MASMPVLRSIFSALAARLVRMTLYALLLTGLAAPAAAEVRALVIASDYVRAKSSMRLSNPVYDSRLIRAALEKGGVQDITLAIEADAAAWQRSLDLFASKLRPDDIALVYYAGHGFQIGGQNFLLTADGETMVSLDQFMQVLTTKAKGTVMIVDACRENPLLAQPDPMTLLGLAPDGSRSVKTIRVSEMDMASRGLAQLGDLRGLSAIVLFSTEPGNVAEDGLEGQGSPFATIAAKELARRQNHDSAFRRIAVGVNRATKGEQSPWRQGDLPFEVFLAGMSHFPVP